MSSNGNVLNEGWDSFYLQHHVKLSNWPMSEAASMENPEVTGMYRKTINKCCLVTLLFSTQEQPLCKWLFQLFSTIQFLFKVHTVPLMQTHCPRMQSNVDNKCYHRIKQQKGSTKWKKGFHNWLGNLWSPTKGLTSLTTNSFTNLAFLDLMHLSINRTFCPEPMLCLHYLISQQNDSDMNSAHLLNSTIHIIERCT